MYFGLILIGLITNYYLVIGMIEISEYIATDILKRIIHPICKTFRLRSDKYFYLYVFTFNRFVEKALRCMDLRLGPVMFIHRYKGVQTLLHEAVIGRNYN